MKNDRRILMLFAAFLLSAVSFTACINPFTLADAEPEPISEPFSAGFDLCGVHYQIEAEEIDLSSASEISAKDLDVLRQIAPYAKNLKEVNLGDENSSPLSWELISRIQEALPGRHFTYRFSLYGEPMTLDTEYIDLRKSKWRMTEQLWWQHSRA